MTIQEGQSGTDDISLAAEPSSTLTITVRVPEGADFTVAPGTMDFTADNWEDTQTVTVDTSEDDDAVNDVEGINHDFVGNGYNVTGAATVSVTITDTDTADITVSESSLTLSEDGSNSFTVELATQPTDDVTVTCRLQRLRGSHGLHGQPGLHGNGLEHCSRRSP